MRTTVNLDDVLLAQAQKISGLADRGAAAARGFDGTDST